MYKMTNTSECQINYINPLGPFRNVTLGPDPQLTALILRKMPRGWGGATHAACHGFLIRFADFCANIFEFTKKTM